MLGPFNSPLAKHLHAAAVASQREHRLSLGSRDRAGCTPPASISSIEVGAGARSPGEQLGVSSPTSPAAQRSRLAISSSAATRSPQPPTGSGQGAAAAAAPSPPPPGDPTAALQELAISKQRAAVAAAAAAMQSPATGARPGPVPRRPLSVAGTPARAPLSTPLAGSSTQPATPASVAPARTPASAGGSTQLQPRTSFKQQAAQLLQSQQQQQQQQPVGRRQSLATPATAAAPAARGSGTSSAQRPAAQRPRPLLYQQQVAAPPTSSLEEAMGQLQLQGSLATAVGPSGTPGLAMRSRGLLTPLTTPRGRPDSAGAALPPAVGSAAGGATPLPLATTAPQHGVQELQAAQPAGQAAGPLLGQPLWSPMLPAAASPSAPLGAGLLGTARKAPRDDSTAGSGSGVDATPSRRPGAEVERAAASDAQQAAGLQHEASFGEPADNPAQLRRQLQAIVPELTLTQLPRAAAAAAGGGGDAASGTAASSRAALPQRPAGVTGPAEAAGLLDRMHKLQAAAAELLEEQGAAATCASVAAGFRSRLPAADAAGRGIVVAVGGARATEQARQQGRKQATAAGPSAAAAARLAKLAQLRAAGSELAAALA